MAVKKVKLNEVAKALHMENKELIHLLDGENKEPKKATRILTEEELDPESFQKVDDLYALLERHRKTGD